MEEFHKDLKQIVTNSKIYNGTDSPYTHAASSTIAEFDTFLQNNALSFSFINILNDPTDEKNSLFILLAYLCQIVSTVASSDVVFLFFIFLF